MSPSVKFTGSIDEAFARGEFRVGRCVEGHGRITDVLPAAGKASTSDGMSWVANRPGSATVITITGAPAPAAARPEDARRWRGTVRDLFALGVVQVGRLLLRPDGSRARITYVPPVGWSCHTDSGVGLTATYPFGDAWIVIEDDPNAAPVDTRCTWPGSKVRGCEACDPNRLGEPAKDHGGRVSPECHAKLPDVGCGPGEPECSQHREYGDGCHSLGCPKREAIDRAMTTIPEKRSESSAVEAAPARRGPVQTWKQPSPVLGPDECEIADTLAPDETPADAHLPRKAP